MSQPTSQPTAPSADLTVGQSASPHSYRLTTISCFVGIFVQAIVSNLTAILFIPMMDLYGFSYIHLGILVGINFVSQVAADILFSNIIDKKGFRFFVLPTCLIAAGGLLLYTATPLLLPGHEFIGIAVSTVIFAFSSGLLEVLLSPIVDAIPGNDKGPAMSLMHSFYAWGQLATIIITTLFIFFFKGENWQIIVLIWMVVPLACFFLFLKAPFPPHKSEESRQTMKQLLFRPYYLLALAAIFCGAGTEVVMNQWASTFMDKALELPKIAGDLLGMGGFAVMLGIGRVIYGVRGSRMNLHKVLIGGSILSMICYLTVVFCPFPLNVAACALCGLGASLLWPGTLVITSAHFPMAGAWLFAILAAAGDIGAAFGSWLTGFVTDSVMGSAGITWLGGSMEQASMRMGVLAAAFFPLLALLCHIVLQKLSYQTEE